MTGVASPLWILLALGVMLIAARAFGAIAEKFGQPAVLGEIAAGFVLGPTVLGQLAPSAMARLFPPTGAHAAVLDGVVELALVLFVLVAGLEVDLSTVWRFRRKVLAVAAAGLAAPVVLGAATVLALPGLVHNPAPVSPMVAALVLGLALSITALPVVARTLQGLGLHTSDLGMVILAAAALDDLGGWIGFATLQSWHNGTATGVFGLGLLVVKPVILAALLVAAGRALAQRALPALLARGWRRCALLAVVAAALLAAAASEGLGIHAVFGAFVIGVATGSTPHIGTATRRTLDRVVVSVLAPFFFVSIGLYSDLSGHLDLLLMGVVFLVACFSKVSACTAAGLWAGASRREALAIGFGMNARGAMEIVLSKLALQQGLIHETTFVALVAMSLATSIVAGPLIRRVLRLDRTQPKLPNDPGHGHGGGSQAPRTGEQ